MYKWDEIGVRIRSEREAHGLTLEALAIKIGTTRQTISRWEKGIGVEITLNMLLQLSNIFECETGYLLCEFDCKMRSATDIQSSTGLSENAINELLSRTQNGAAPQINILSSLICDSGFWRVLMNTKNAIESERLCDSDAEPEIKYNATNGKQSVVLKGMAVSDHFINTAVNVFTATITDLTKRGKQ